MGTKIRYSPRWQLRDRDRRRRDRDPQGTPIRAPGTVSGGPSIPCNHRDTSQRQGADGRSKHPAEGRSAAKIRSTLWNLCCVRMGRVRICNLPQVGVSLVFSRS
jgi:hypothetical protein